MIHSGSGTGSNTPSRYYIQPSMEEITEEEYIQRKIKHSIEEIHEWTIEGAHCKIDLDYWSECQQEGAYCAIYGSPTNS